MVKRDNQELEREKRLVSRWREKLGTGKSEKIRDWKQNEDLRQEREREREKIKNWRERED